MLKNSTKETRTTSPMLKVSMTVIRTTPFMLNDSMKDTGTTSSMLKEFVKEIGTTSLVHKHFTKEKGTTSLMLNYSFKETANYSQRLENYMTERGNAPSRQIDTVEEKRPSIRISLNENRDISKMQMFYQMKPQTSSENKDKKYVIDKLVGHTRTRRETFYEVRWYGYSLADNTLKREADVVRNFVVRYGPSKTETKLDNSKRRGSRTPN